MPPDVPQPWDAFLKDLDAELEAPVELHCLGGFVLAMRRYQVFFGLGQAF
jgi:hypothetical protein